MKILSLGFIMLLLTSCGMQSIPTALNEVDAQWAEVQNQYKRRSDLIPNLVSTVKGYASHEKDTLQAVVEARAKATSVNVSADKLNTETLGKFSKAQSGLSSALGRLMVVVEKYPDLKANANFRDLQVQLEGTENRITVARNRYIQSIKAFNNLITVPPTSWYNSIFLKHEKKPQFEVENLKEAQEAPKVKF
ncbi:LemA family protein [Halobacteriovorax sp. JY17]|uniref:LemA family protein n=1 Tax=Halobacteriovorax sp. JY17 TaxID=2014617 RepID=UPI000C43D07C|nr:LemA family protein [Halobacteriovorax sp. JY17]PIK16390.1 MAG: LemA family protein [Halobacteriovorax sp. JY17]